MDKIEARHDVELNRLYDILGGLVPGTEEYDKVLNEIKIATEGRNEYSKVRNASDEAKKERAIKITTFAAGLVLAPVVDLLCKRSLAKFIGTVEQMELFTSTPGKSISSWFRWK